MKKITLSRMIENFNMDARLIRSTIRQCGGFENFKEHALDVVNHGIDGGTFGGFIYYVDTCAFFRRNKKYILEFAEVQAAEIGYNSLLEMIKDFKCIKSLSVTENELLKAIYQGKGDYVDQIQNCLAWYIGEEVCRMYNNLKNQRIKSWTIKNYQ